MTFIGVVVVWATVFEWVRTLAGALIGVFVGARLTQKAQDRQFSRQRAAQRLDRAHAAYQEAGVVAIKLAHRLDPSNGHPLYGPIALTKLGEDVPALIADLTGSAIKLQGEGAQHVVDPLFSAANKAHEMYASIARQTTVIAKGQDADVAEKKWHEQMVEEFSSTFNQFKDSWDEWTLQQESLETLTRRKWWPWARRSLS